MTEDREPTTQELRAVQTRRAHREREAAADAATESAERAHHRRAAKAAYLEQRLAEQQHADDEAGER